MASNTDQNKTKKKKTTYDQNSFNFCGLSVKTYGNEADLILCFRQGQPCTARLQVSACARSPVITGGRLQL